MFSALLFVGCAKNELVVTADLKPEKGNEYLFAKAYAEDGTLVDSTSIVDNKFVLTFPTLDYPSLGKISITKKRGGGGKLFVLTPGKMTYMTEVGVNTTSHTANTIRDKGGYNDLIYNNWRETPEMDRKFGAWRDYKEANGAAYFSKATPIEEKLSIRTTYDSLANIYKAERQDFLAQYLTSKDLYMVALAIKEMKVNAINEKYVPVVVEALGERHEWVRKFERDREYFLDLQARKAKIAIGAKVMDIAGITKSGKKVSLLDVASENKSTMLLIMDGKSDSKKYFPFICDAYAKYSKKGFTVFGVWTKSLEDYNDFLKENKVPFTMVVNVPNLDEVLEHYDFLYGMRMLFVDNNGVITNQAPHRYSVVKTTGDSL